MFTIDANKIIHITRGDVCAIEIGADTTENERYIFKPGDIVRMRVFVRKKHDQVVLVKDVLVESEAETVDIPLETSDTKIGDIINKPIDYWYEIELNPNTTPQTIIGYDDDGPKIFRLYPEGGDMT